MPYSHLVIEGFHFQLSEHNHSPLLSPSVNGALTFWSFWVLWLPAHGFTVFPHNPALLVHYFTSFLSPILCLLVHLLQLSCQCPTLNPARHLPSHSPSLHSTDGYYHNFTASHCSPSFRVDGCMFHPLSRSSLMLFEHHLSSHQTSHLCPSQEGETPHCLCTTCIGTSLSPFSGSLPQGMLHPPLTLHPPFSSRLKACFHLMFQISHPSSHLLSWLLAPGCVISWIIRWMRSPPWPCAHTSAKMSPFPPALLLPFWFCWYIKKKKVKRVYYCLQPPPKGGVCAQSLQSHTTPCDPTNCSLPGSSVHGILQARILEWVAMPSPRGSSRSRDWTHISCVSCIADEFFTTEPLGKSKGIPPGIKSRRRFMTHCLQDQLRRDVWPLNHWRRLTVMVGFWLYNSLI